MKKTILVTGAAVRIGREIALTFAKDGWNIIIHCNSSTEKAEALAKEIEEKRIITSSNPIIARTENDQLILKSGQAYQIDYVGTNQNGIQFRLKDSDGLLTIPFDNVRSLTSRMGDVIYPEAIEYRTSQ